EYNAGGPTTVAQSFRSYGSLQQGISDYVNLLSSIARYQPALGTGEDVHAFAHALARGGYATGPAYVQKREATVGHVRALRVAAGSAAFKIPAEVPTTGPGEPS